MSVSVKDSSNPSIGGIASCQVQVNPASPQSVSFSASGAASPATVQVGAATALQTNFTNTGIALLNVIFDIEIVDMAGNKVFQQFFTDPDVETGATRSFFISFTPNVTGLFNARVGVFRGDWGVNYFWQNNLFSINSVSAPTTSNIQPLILSPTPDGATLPRTQSLFKVQLQSMQLGQYKAFWQVDGDHLNAMIDSHDPSNPAADHNEYNVDLTGWTWKGSGPYGPYTINFVFQDLAGNVIAQKATTIWVTSTTSTGPVANIISPTPDGVTLSRTQSLFKVQLQGMQLGQYKAFWQVDGDHLNAMIDSHDPANPAADHNEYNVDLTGWTWKGSGPYGPYTINFVFQDLAGNVITQKATTIWVSQ